MHWLPNEGLACASRGMPTTTAKANAARPNTPANAVTRLFILSLAQTFAALFPFSRANRGRLDLARAFVIVQ